jgi:LacI family transcriptional regulator
MRAVDMLGFEPDSAAQAMRSRATNTIGCMVSDISNPLYAEIINGADQELQRENYILMLGTTRQEEQQELALISALRRRRMDGLLLTAGEDWHAATGAALAALKMPCVGIDRIDPGASTVRADHRSGAMEATRYLIGLGHRRIALLMGSATMLPGAERLAGFRQAHEAAGVEIDMSLVRPQMLATSFAFSEVRHLLQIADPPTAIITLGTRMLAGVLEALASSGLKVPEDVSLISVGDTDLARHATPSVTALTWDLGELGRTAGRTLLEQIRAGGEAVPKAILLPTRLILRHSCAPCREKPASRAPAGVKRRMSSP